MDHFSQWAQKLPDRKPPSCPSLPQRVGCVNEAALHLSNGSFDITFEAINVCAKLRKMRTTSVESCFESKTVAKDSLETIRTGLDLLADLILTDLSPITRRKCEHRSLFINVM